MDSVVEEAELHEVENLLSGKPVALIMPSYDRYASESAPINSLVSSTDIPAATSSSGLGVSIPPQLCASEMNQAVNRPVLNVHLPFYMGGTKLSSTWEDCDNRNGQVRHEQRLAPSAILMG